MLTILHGIVALVGDKHDWNMTEIDTYTLTGSQPDNAALITDMNTRDAGIPLRYAVQWNAILYRATYSLKLN